MEQKGNKTSTLIRPVSFRIKRQLLGDETDCSLFFLYLWRKNYKTKCDVIVVAAQGGGLLKRYSAGRPQVEEMGVK